MSVLIKRIVAIMVCSFMVVVSMNYSRAVESTSAEKLNQLGLLLNISQVELEAKLSREIGLSMILKALGYTNNEAETYESKSPFVDTQSWSKGWASLAYALNITKGTTTTTFSPTGQLSEREFLTFLLRALGYDKNESYSNTLELAKESGLVSGGHSLSEGAYTKSDAAEAMFNSLSSIELNENVPLANILMAKGLFDLNQAASVGINDLSLNRLRVYVKSYNKIDVVFSESVKVTDYVFDINSETLSYRAMVNWNADKTIASIQMVSPLEPGKYVMTTSELVGERNKFINEFFVDDKEEFLDILSDTIAFVDGSYINYSLTDVYQVESYADFQSIPTITAENLTKGLQHNVQIMDSLNAHRLKLPNIVSEGARIGDVIRVKLQVNGQTTTKDLEVVLKGKFESFELHNPVPAAGSNRFSINQKNIAIPYVASGDKGTALKLNMHSTNYDQSNNIEIIDDIIFTSSNTSVLDVDSIKVNIDGFLKVDFGSSPGITTLRAYNSKDKTTSEMQIAIYPESNLVSVEVMPQTKLIAIGEEIKLEAIGFDQFGAQVSIGYISGLTFTSSDEDIISGASANLLNNFFVCEGLEEGSATITIHNKLGTKLGTCDLQIVGEPRPQNITELNIPKYFEASSNANITIRYSNLVVIDQFAREYDLDVNDERIYIEEEDSDEVNINIGIGNFGSGGLEISGIDDEIGAFEYRVYIEDMDYSAFIFTITTVEENDITEYKLADVETLKVDTNPTVDVELKGYLESGEEVVLQDNKVTIVTSSDLSVATATVIGNTISIIGKEAGTSTISVWDESEILSTVQVTVLAADE